MVKNSKSKQSPKQPASRIDAAAAIAPLMRPQPKRFEVSEAKGGFSIRQSRHGKGEDGYGMEDVVAKDLDEVHGHMCKHFGGGSCKE